MIETRAGARTNRLWICRSCRRGTLGESACEYCSAPRRPDTPVPARIPEPVAQQAPAPAPAPAKAKKERRLHPPRRLLVLVVLAVALIGGGLFVSGHMGASKPASVASVARGYVPPSRHLPAPRTVALPAALTAAPSSGDLITPAAATAVVHAAWDLRHQSLAPPDAPALAAFETGTALDVDAARSGNPYGGANQVVVSVPHQNSFPARFLAEVTTTQSQRPWVALLVFTRADGQSPWKLDLMGGYTGEPSAMKPLALDAAGFSSPQTARPLVDPSTVHGLLAQYWRFSNDNGKVPPAPLWEPGPWTTTFATQLARLHQAGGSHAYQAAPNGNGYVFPEADGWQIACSPIYMQDTVGNISKYRIAVPCIEVPSAGSGQKVRVNGAQSYTDVATSK